MIFADVRQLARVAELLRVRVDQAPTDAGSVEASLKLLFPWRTPISLGRAAGLKTSECASVL